MLQKFENNQIFMCTLSTNLRGYFSLIQIFNVVCDEGFTRDRNTKIFPIENRKNFKMGILENIGSEGPIEFFLST